MSLQSYTIETGSLSISCMFRNQFRTKFNQWVTLSRVQVFAWHRHLRPIVHPNTSGRVCLVKQFCLVVLFNDETGVTIHCNVRYLIHIILLTQRVIIPLKNKICITTANVNSWWLTRLTISRCNLKLQDILAFSLLVNLNSIVIYEDI